MSSDMQQQMQQTMMMQQQMQHLQQQNLMIQQMQAQLNNSINNGNDLNNNQGQGSSSNGQTNNAMFDMSALNTMGMGGASGGSSNFNSMMGSSFNNGNSNMGGGNTNQGGMGGIMDPSNPVMGMRRTSLGFMPYLPTSNRRDSGFATTASRRDSGFSISGLSTVSNDLGSSFTAGGATSGLGGGVGGDLGGMGNSTQSIEQFRKLDMPTVAGAGGDTSNATFDAQGGGDKGNGAANEDDFRHSQAKLAVLEDMIAKERKKQSMLSGLDPDPVNL